MRCVTGGVSFSPEFDSALSRKSLLTVLLFAAVAGIAGWAIFWGERALVDRPAPSPTADAIAPAFLGASSDRVFLSLDDSREATQRGLLPGATRSILRTNGKLAFGAWRWDDRGVPAGPITVRVDLQRQLVSVFRGPDEIGTAVVVYGIDGKDTPRGKLPILGKARDYHSITYDAPMPFSLWLRGDGVALHGSSVAMGKATNGCIGVPVEFAGKLFAIAEEGDIIEVIGGSATS